MSILSSIKVEDDLARDLTPLFGKEGAKVHAQTVIARWVRDAERDAEIVSAMVPEIPRQLASETVKTKA